MPWASRVLLISSNADLSRSGAVARSGAVGFVVKDDLAAGLLAELLTRDP